MAESYDAGTIVIQTYSAGSQVIQSYDAGAFVVPQAPVVSYPVGALLDYYFPATSLVLADLAPVTSHTDVNTGTKTIAQAVVASQPAYHASQLGYPAVKCDGINDHLFSTDTDLMLNGAAASFSGACLFVISGGGNTSGEPGGWANSTSTSRYLTHRFASATQYSAPYGSTGSAGLLAAAGGTYDTAAINAMLLTASGGTLKVWRNGTQIASVAISGDWAHDRFAMGGRLRATFVVPTTAYFHATGLAFGSVAAALHSDPSALFAACTTEWGTP